MLPMGALSAHEPPEPGAAPENTIIVARPVAYGTALHRESKSPALRVVTGPHETVIGAVATGLKPIDDDAAAAVIAPTVSARQLAIPGSEQVRLHGAFSQSASLRGGQAMGGAGISSVVQSLPSVGAIVAGALGSGE